MIYMYIMLVNPTTTAKVKNKEKGMKDSKIKKESEWRHEASLFAAMHDELTFSGGGNPGTVLIGRGFGIVEVLFLSLFLISMLA